MSTNKEAMNDYFKSMNNTGQPVDMQQFDTSNMNRKKNDPYPDGFTAGYHDPRLSQSQVTQARVSSYNSGNNQDPGHVGAMNIALYNQTNGSMGMSVQQAKDYKNAYR
jgi:hypothetical protein